MKAHARPAWTLSVDGADITAKIAERLASLTLTDNRGFEADQLDIDLDDSDGKLDLPPRGALIRLALGWASDAGATLVDKGSYTVDELEHSGAPDKLTVRARSADLRGGLTTQMERSFHGKTLRDIVRTIAHENDLLPVMSFSLSEIVIDHIDQTNESSANLLTRLARQFDAIASVKSNLLLFLTAATGKSASGKPLPVATIFRGDGDQHRFTLAEREAFSAVRATYYDTHLGKKGEVIWGKDEEAVARGKKKPVAAPTPEPVASPTAPKLKALATAYKSRKKALRACVKAWQALKPKAGWDGVKASYDDRVNQTHGEVSYGRADEARQHKSAVALAVKDEKKIAGTPQKESPPAFDHSADNIKTIRHVYASKENASRAARSDYLRLGRGVATFSLTLAHGRPELFPEVPVAVRGWKPAIDDTDWIVSRVVHNVTGAGYTTTVELEIRATEVPG